MRDFVAACEAEELTEIPERVKYCAGIDQHLFKHHVRNCEEFEIQVERYGNTLTETVWFDNDRIEEAFRI